MMQSLSLVFALFAETWSSSCARDSTCCMEQLSLERIILSTIVIAAGPRGGRSVKFTAGDCYIWDD